MFPIMRVISTLSAVLSIAFTATMAHAVSAPPPVVNRNVSFQAEIMGYPDSPTKNVSGTNAGFNVWVGSWSFPFEEWEPHWDTAWVSYVRISIGGETVCEWNLQTAGLKRGAKSFSVQWDTTHFQHLNTKEIRVQANCIVKNGLTEVEFPTNDATVNVCVYNRGAVMIQKEWESEVPIMSTVVSAPENMHHQTSQDASGWTAAYALDGIRNSTACYISTHGTSACFQSDADVLPGIKEMIFPSAVLGARQLSVTDGIPPMNLAFLDACNTGQTDAFAGPFLYPGSPTADRCEIGWKVDALNIWIDVFNTAFWGALDDGETANVARSAGIAALVNAGQLPRGAIPTDYLAIWGDSHARVSSLYTGTDLLFDPAPGTPFWANVTSSP